MKKKLRVYYFVLWTFLMLGNSNSFAANLYWKTIPIDNQFTNLGNWELTPGMGNSPAQAPTSNDDVFFNSSSTVTSILLNNGVCQSLNVNAPTLFALAGNLTIYGSFISNGNAIFGNGALSYLVSGVDTIESRNE